MSVNALQLNTGGRIVIEPGLERVSPVQEPATVPWTAIGILGLYGVPALSLVVEEKELELDSVTDLGMEERIVSDSQNIRRNVTLRAVQLMVIGALGGPGVSAPSPVLERMESLGKNPVRVNVLLLNTGGTIVTQLGLKRSRPVQEKTSASLSVQ